MPQMKAVTMDEYGGPGVLRMSTRPLPQRRPGEALIRVVAVGVNPADAKWRAGEFAALVPLLFPYIPGYDFSGVIVASERFEAGTPVCGNLAATGGGAYAEFAACEEGVLARVPNALTFLKAAAIPTAALTGVQLIERHICPSRGDRILITGASGAVGRFAVNAAKALGAHVTAVVRESHFEAAMQAGADEAVSIDHEPGDAIVYDHLVDTVGGASVAPWCGRIKHGGRIRTVATTPIPQTHLTVFPEFVAVQSDGERLAKIAQSIAAGLVDMPINSLLPLSEVQRAHRLLEQGGLAGKIILTVAAH